MLNTIIIDDNPGNIDTLSTMLDIYCSQVNICATALDIENGYEKILKLKPALVFLDIEMPGGNGFELLRKFDTLPFDVIFTTAYNQYAVQAFRENALDYLLKPIDVGSLQQAVERAAEKAERKHNEDYQEKYRLLLQKPFTNKIPIPVLDGYLFINHRDIIRCEASGSYTHFFMVDRKKLVVSLGLKECEGLLPEGVFFRIHHSHIINLHYIVRYIRGRGGSIVMEDGSTVELSTRKKDAFMELMKKGI